MNFGMTEILIIAAIIILLFGARKLPELAKGLGSSIKEFKKGLDNKEEEPKE
jgi:sec-independent protein translocase protein TatA